MPCDAQAVHGSGWLYREDPQAKADRSPGPQSRYPARGLAVVAFSTRPKGPAPPWPGRAGRARLRRARDNDVRCHLRPVAGNAVPRPGHTTANTPLPAYIPVLSPLL